MLTTFSVSVSVYVSASVFVSFFFSLSLSVHPPLSLSVLNHMASTVLANASLTAKLQSPSGRVDLEDRRTARGASVSRPNPAPSLGPSDNLDMIVEHTLQELGTHTLRVRGG